MGPFRIHLARLVSRILHIKPRQQQQKRKMNIKQQIELLRYNQNIVNKRNLKKRERERKF